MIADLIKLSRKLSKLDLVEESHEIDDLIGRLYGLPTSGGSSSEDYNSLNTQSSLEDIGTIINNSNDEFLCSELSDILINSLSYDNLEVIKASLIDYLD